MRSMSPFLESTYNMDYCKSFNGMLCDSITRISREAGNPLQDLIPVLPPYSFGVVGVFGEPECTAVVSPFSPEFIETFDETKRLQLKGEVTCPTYARVTKR